MRADSARLYSTDRNQDCIDACTQCHQLCTESAMQAVAVGGRHADPEFVRLLEDCADMSMTAARFLIRRSDLHRYACRACFSVAARCADECERLGMLTCAEACRRCAEACAQVAMDPTVAGSAIVFREQAGVTA